jgi:hypothetical protein
MGPFQIIILTCGLKVKQAKTMSSKLQRYKISTFIVCHCISTNTTDSAHTYPEYPGYQDVAGALDWTSEWRNSLP